MPNRTIIELGEDVRLIRSGTAVDLPQSKKTRGLIAYLAIEQGPVRRERLCELFWPLAADPRQSLRWSLSKLRGALGEDAGWLVADRNEVRLDAPASQLHFCGDAEHRLAALDPGDHEEFAQWIGAQRGRAPMPRNNGTKQVIRYTTAEDGTRLAYATMGSGPPLMKAANWLSHLDAEMEVPFWSGLLNAMAARHTLYRYDERGNGLSDWKIADFSFDAWVRDLELVVEASGLERFPLLGISQGGAVSIAYAHRNPDKVSALILLGAYPAGWRLSGDADYVNRRAAEMELVEHGWGENSPAYRQIFSHTFLPDATAEEIERFNNYQRQTTSGINARRFINIFGDIDVRRLVPDISVPTLVLHSRDDQRVACDVGRKLAATMPNAQFRTLPTSNHIPLAREPAFAEMITAIDDFLDRLPTG